MKHKRVLSLLLPSLVSLVACVSEEVQTEFDDEKGDTVCQSAELRFESTKGITQIIEHREIGGVSSFTGTLEMKLNGAHYLVDEAEVIYRPGRDAWFEISIESPALDPFTTLQFWVDYREVATAESGQSEWQKLDLNKWSDTSGWWFDRLNFDSRYGSGDYSTVGANPANCSLASARESSFAQEGTPFRGKSMEYRIRAYPKSGLWDLAGSYEYTLSLETISSKLN